MIRLYENKDREHLVELLRLNTPKFFDSSEEKDFKDYLDHDSENYFVIEEHEKINGGGGLNFGFDEGATARIAWDVILPSAQGKGVGTQLTNFRIGKIKLNPTVNKIVVRRSQLVFPFYEKLGFELEQKERDYWAKGFDLYQMKLE